MAWLYFQHGQTKRAEIAVHQLIQVLPKHPEALHLLGVIALQDGNTESATRFLQEAVSNSLPNPVLLSNLGLALHEQGKLEQAEIYYRQAIKANLNYPDAYYNLHALLLEHNLPGAIECLNKVIMLLPQDFDARLTLGILLERSGKLEEAQQQFDGLKKAQSLYKARLDAWEYIHKAGSKSLPMLGSNISTFKLALEAAKPEGLILEFGVRHGNTLRQIAGLVKQKVHGFDSFEGLPEVWHHEPKGSYTTKGVVPEMPANVELHVGWFEDTLPGFLKAHEGPVRLINVDCDIYSSTKTVLDALASRIVSGSVLVFDEYIGNEHWREDEYKAFQEAVKAYGWRYEYLSFSMFTKQVAVQIL